MAPSLSASGARAPKAGIYLSVEDLAAFDRYKVRAMAGEAGGGPLGAVVLAWLAHPAPLSQYNSIDSSPLSQYVMKPFWLYTVKVGCRPSWAAPRHTPRPFRFRNPPAPLVLCVRRGSFSPSGSRPTS